MYNIVSLSKRLLLAAFIIASAALFCSLLPVNSVSAQTGIPAAGVPLDGYAWSSNIGWISMNCRTGGTTGNNICGTSNYSVVMDNSGWLSGYAWSDHIGWIKFGGLSSFPNSLTGTTVAANARATGAYPNHGFTGWARACAGTNLPDASESKDCSTMTMNDNSGNWDGWISLRQTGANTHGITMSSSGASPSSFAWGGTVVGWIDFDQILFLMTSATISGTGCGNIPIGGSTCSGTVTWNIANATSPNVINTTTGGAAAYSVASGNSQPITLRAGAAGNIIAARDGTSQLQTTTLYATCVAGADFSNGTTCQATPPVVPVISLVLSKPIARIGDTVTATWTITPSPVASGSCTLSGPGLSGATTTSGNQTSAPLRAKSRFGIACTGAYGTVEASASVEIIPSAQEV